MSEALTLPAETRERAGKGASRALRRDNRIPAVIYGGKEEPLMIHLEQKELVRQLMTGHFMNSIVMIEVGGKSVRVLPKDVAFHPVTDVPTHVDFFRLSKDAKIEVEIPVVFVNQEASPGLKKGAVLNVVRHELVLMCVSDKIPDEIAIDVTGLEVGDSIHISAIPMPEGSEVHFDRDYTVATIVAPSALRSKDEDSAADAEAAEGEAAPAAEGEEKSDD